MCWRTVRASRLLALLLLLAVPLMTQAQYEYTVENGTVTITRYTGPGGDVVIPDTLNDLPVTRIGWGAFLGRIRLTSVTIPDSVTSIEGAAFSGCTWLSKVTLGRGVGHIERGAFSGCTRLTNIEVDALNPWFNSVEGVLFNESLDTLILCPAGMSGSYIIPESVIAIGGGAFSGCTRLTSVPFPNSLTSIGESAFADCTSVTTVTIPECVTNIGSGAFSGCTGLTSIMIGNSVTDIGSGAFSGCSGLTSVMIPDSVTSIDGAFWGCTSLTSVTLGSSVASMARAFEGCTSLTSVTIPGSVTSIDGTFSMCFGLTNVTIPNSVTSIGPFAFSGCSSLTNVTIPNSVTSIDWRAFSGCSSLGSITIPDSVTIIGVQAFSSCTALTNVTIGNSVTSIELHAFASCTGLTSVTIPYSVKSVDWRAFYLCSNLTSVHFEGNAPSLGTDVFEGTSPTIYYNPRTAGWGETFGGLPTVAVDQELVFAGLTIRGEVGKVYSIECTAVLGESSQSTWRCLEFLQLPASPYCWSDKSALATRNRFYRAVTVERPANMVFIPLGTFRMGSPENELGFGGWESPQTDVIISRGFWMGKFEVTQGEYVEVMGNNPSYFNGVRVIEDSETDYGTDLNRPVETVSWNDAVAYCAALTERERAAGRIPANCVYRLPTEAEWEYACRAWTSTRFSYGDDPDDADLTNYAWYGGNSHGTTHPVGQKLPNPWGLYDIHGNVSEWCQDWWSESLPGGIVVDPQNGSSWSSFGRVIRGGDGYVYGEPSWSAYSCRSADRSLTVPPDYGYEFIGLRVVLAPVRP